jgi:hypothetical protein
MQAVSNIVREVIGLFVDDNSLAAVTAAILAAAGLARHAGIGGTAVAAILLCGGLAIALLENVLRSTRAIQAEVRTPAD